MRIPLVDPLLSLLLLLLSTTPPGALAARKWYDVHFATTPHPEPVEYFIELSGQMVIPKLVSPGAYYAFPALVSRDMAGIYQNVLDGNKGYWTFASGWCCFKGWPWGDGFDVSAGDVVSFHNEWDRAGDKHAPWTTTIRHDSTDMTRTNSWALGGRLFNQAPFAIEVYGKAWDFGPLEFRNIVIKSNGRDTSWCKPVTDTTIYYIENLNARVTPQGVVCSIDKLILEKPIPGRYPPREKE